MLGHKSIYICKKTEGKDNEIWINISIVQKACKPLVLISLYASCYALYLMNYI